MHSLIVMVLIALSGQIAEPWKPSKNNPDGVWQTDAGTRFEMKLTESELHVRLVDGSNPVYVKYEVELKNAGEINSYQGDGYFIAKVDGKECRFETTWSIVVVQPQTIAGVTSRIVPEPGSCAVKERSEQFTQLKKVD